MARHFQKQTSRKHKIPSGHGNGLQPHSHLHVVDHFIPSSVPSPYSTFRSFTVRTAHASAALLVRRVASRPADRVRPQVTGRNSRTRFLSRHRPRCHPIRSATAVVGVVGYRCSSSRIRGSTASTTDPARPALVLIRRPIARDCGPHPCSSRSRTSEMPTGECSAGWSMRRARSLHKPPSC